EALAAALGEPHAAAEVVRVAANVVGAPVGLLWEDDGGGALRLAASHGLPPDTEVDAARELAQRALDVPGPIHAVDAEGLPAGRRAARAARDVRGARGERVAGEREGALARARARADACAPRGRRPGDGRALARAHPRDRGRPRLGAARGRVGRGLPPR